jgi:hypothetical protein
MDRGKDKLLTKIALHAMGLLVLMVGGLGLLAPYLVSAPSDLAVLLGFIVLGLVLLGCVKYGLIIGDLVNQFINYEENVNDE